MAESIGSGKLQCRSLLEIKEDYRGSPQEEISANTFSASSPVALLPSTYADAACPIRHGVLGITLICTWPTAKLLSGMKKLAMPNGAWRASVRDWNWW